MSNWNTLTGYKAWSVELKKLIKEANGARKKTDKAKRTALRKKLKTFIIKSKPNNADILRLDEIARDLSNDLILSDLSLLADAFAEREQDVIMLTKELHAEADAIEKDASKVRMEKAAELANSLTESVTKVNGLLANLEGMPEAAKKKLATRLAKLTKEVQDARGEVEAIMAGMSG